MESGSVREVVRCMRWSGVGVDPVWKVIRFGEWFGVGGDPVRKVTRCREWSGAGGDPEMWFGVGGDPVKEVTSFGVFEALRDGLPHLRLHLRQPTEGLVWRGVVVTFL